MSCRICSSTRLEPVIDLGEQPWCNHFLQEADVGKEPFYPLRVMYCHDCATSQLDYTVKKEVMFGDHSYLSGVTDSLSTHFKQVAEDLDREFFADRQDKFILDIGSNDGTQLKHFQALGWKVLGVESSRTTAAIANEAGVDTMNAFFNLKTMQKVGLKVDAFNAAGVFFHLEELHSVCEAIKWGLKDDGVFVVQFLYMKSIMENMAFDQIYHEHLLYYTLATIERLLDRHGLQMFDARFSSIHGGSIIGYIGHIDRRPVSERLRKMRAEEDSSGCNTVEAYRDFHTRILQMKAENLAFLRKAKSEGKSVWGFGAPVKGNTMLNYFGAGTDLIQKLVERNELRRNLYSPGMHIPIVIEDDLTEHPDIYFVLAWNFKEEILRRNEHLIKDGVTFYFPVDPERNK